jgi:hypothetical protein
MLMIIVKNITLHFTLQEAHHKDELHHFLGSVPSVLEGFPELTA